MSTTSFKEADLSNLDYNKGGMVMVHKSHKEKHYRDALTEQLQALAKRLGRTPTRDDFRRYGMVSAYALYRVFGTYTAALEAAGLEPNYLKKLRRVHTEKELIELLRAFAQQLGRTPTANEVNHNLNMPSTAPFIVAFGTYNNALQAAGLKINKRGKLSEDELLTSLKDFTKRLGKTPTVSEVANDPGMPSLTPFVEMFGSFRGALQAAGLTPDAVVRYDYTLEEVIEETIYDRWVKDRNK